MRHVQPHPPEPAASSREVVAEIERAGIVAVIRTHDASRVRAIADALVAGGVRVLEVTMTVPGAVEAIRELAMGLADACVLGAGTVTDPDAAERVVAAGARFVVSPIHDPRVVAWCRDHQIAVMPGCFSPTEILNAWREGADIVKVFPAGAMGPQYLRDLRGPLPQVKLMPTGGVTIENAGDWIRAGAAAVGIGTALLDPQAIAGGHFARLTAKARRLLEAVDIARADGARGAAS